jgi:hypothetical protein
MTLTFWYFPKEIALLKGDRTQCWTYYINLHAHPLPTSTEYHSQKESLRLAWSYGEHTIDEAVALIKEKVAGDDFVFVSDHAAFLFFETYLLSVTYQQCELGFEMTHCPSENCDLNHGSKCARRKVHELRYSDHHDL